MAEPGAPEEKEVNPFQEIVDRDRKMPGGAPSYLERLRLNAVDSFYRGSIAGASGLYAAKRNAESNAYPTAAYDYSRALYDLGKYDATPSWDGPLEGAVALAGQFGGAMLSPEAWINRIPGVGRAIEPMLGHLTGTAIGRTAEAAATQGLVQLGTDPVVQAMSIASGQQHHYEPIRTAVAPLFGAALGGTIHGATEFGRAIGGAVRDVRAERAAHGAEPKPGEPSVEVPNPGVPGEAERAVATRHVQEILTNEKARLAEHDPDLKSPIDTEPTAFDPNAALSKIEAELNLPEKTPVQPAEAVAPGALKSPGKMTDEELLKALGDLDSVLAEPKAAPPKEPVALTPEVAKAPVAPPTPEVAAVKDAMWELIKDISGKKSPSKLDFYKLSHALEKSADPAFDNLKAFLKAQEGKKPTSTALHKVISGLLDPGETLESKIKLIKSEGPATTGFYKDVADAGAKAAAHLPMDEASRIKRAKALGFNTDKTFYHGTNKDFMAFDPSLGKGMEKAIFVTDHPHIAEKYVSYVSDKTPNIVPLYAKIENPMVVDWPKENKGNPSYSGSTMGALIQKAKKAGNDVVVIHNIHDLGGTQTQYAFLKPQNLRAKYGAAFDPQMAHLANMLFSEPVKGAPVDSEIAHIQTAFADLRAAGVKPNDVTPSVLESAIEHVRSGDETTGAAALERAVVEELPEGVRNAIYGEATSTGGGMAAKATGPEVTRAGEAPGPAGETGGSPRAATAAADAGLQFSATATEGGVKIPLKPAPPSGERGPVLSPQQQVKQISEDLAATMRTGRIVKAGAGGQYDPVQDVARIRNAADIETAAHELAHALEKRFGPELSNVIVSHAAELGPMDYNPALQRPFEGFAEYLKFMISNPSHASASAPQFETAFRQFMEVHGPETMKAVERAQKTFSDFHAAPASEQINSMVHNREQESLVKEIRKEGFPATISMVLGRAYEAMFDDQTAVVRAFRDLARMIYKHEGARPTLEGSDNPDNMFRMWKMAHQAAVGDMRDGIRIRGQETGVNLRQPLIDATGDPGAFGHWDAPKMKSFDAYLAALAADWRYEKFELTGKGRRPIAMERAKLQEGIAQFEAANPGFRRGADGVHAYSQVMLQKLYDHGLIGHELYTTLLQEKFYVPLFRDLSEKPLWAGEPTSGASRAEGPGNAQLIRRQEGSDRDIISPLQSLMTMTFLANRTVMHNEAILSLKRLATRAKTAGATGAGRIFEDIGAHDVVPTSFQLLDAVRNAADKHGMDPADIQVLSSLITDAFGGEDPIMATIFKRQPTGARDEPIVFFREGGSLRAARIISKEEGIGLYEAITTLPSEMQDAAIRFTAATSNILRAGITTNPVFAFTNFIRDQMAAAILRPYVPFNPSGLKSELRQDEFARAYAYYGGVNPGAGAAGLGELVDGGIDQLARKGWKVQKLGAMRDVFREGKVLEGFKSLGEVVGVAESGTRLNVFKQVYRQKIEQGLSVYDAQIEAARVASDLLDFNRHGSRTEAIRSLVPFFNAHIQALDKARRTIIEPMTRKIMGDIVTTAEEEAFRNSTLTIAKMLGIGGALGYAYGQLMSDHPAYRDANADLRATHMIIPGEVVGLPGKIVTIPKPFELAIGFNLGELTGLGVATGDPRMADFAKKGVYEVIAPPNLMESIPIVKTWAELSLNRSFFTHRDIVPERLQGLAPAEQYQPGKTSSMARKIGEMIGVSPIKVDYTLGSLFGLWGKDLMAASNIADPNAAAAPFESQMFIRRFVKSTGFSEMTGKFWEYAAQKNGTFARADNTYMNMLQVQHRDQDAMTYLNALPEAQRAYVTLKSAASEDDPTKQAFTTEMRALHPLTRAHNAVTVSSTYARELAQNAQRQIETGERADMDPGLRRNIIEHLQALAEMEQMNALIAIGEPGFKGRKPMSTQDQFDTIMTLHPAAGIELATRYAAAKIPEQNASAKAWPEMQRLLLERGGKADLKALTADVYEAGWQFGYDRAVGRPARRRLPISPALQPGPP